MVKNKKDSVKDTASMPAPYQAVGFGSGSYTKTNKLVTALYMVTDIMDKDEPLRNNLRTLGVEIVSDIISASKLNLDKKIQEVLSFLDIASAINIISPMNCNILKKEFLELKQSIKESTQIEPIWLEEFLETSSPAKGRIEEGSDPLAFQALSLSRGRENSKRHTRIGVQKGSTLMKALSDINPLQVKGNDFNILKRQRRDEILKIISDHMNRGDSNGEGLTITDIRTRAKDFGDKLGIKALLSCGEKTLQRELISMVRDNVLNKTGSKRWSRYFLPK